MAHAPKREYFATTARQPHFPAVLSSSIPDQVEYIPAQLCRFSPENLHNCCAGSPLLSRESLASPFS